MSDRQQRKKCKGWQKPPASSLPNEWLSDFRFAEFVYFDLELSGVCLESSEIIQISAISERGTFNVYCLPVRTISSVASEVNSLTVQNGKLHHKGIEVESCNPEQGLASFLTFLELHDECMIVSHGASVFDAKFLIKKLDDYGLMTRAKDAIVGIIDTYKFLIRRFKNERKSGKLVNFKLKTLVEFLLEPNYDFETHNAQADAAALKNIVNVVKPTPIELKKACILFGTLIQIQILN